MSQIKSKKRVRDYGEVFTNEREVKAMCDLIPAEIWENIRSKFLEPACGNGNFLVEIYARKLDHCQTEKDGLIALASIVGIDILEDNCNESRERLLAMYLERFPQASHLAIAMAWQILCNNIICGDSLEIMNRWTQDETFSIKMSKKS